MAGPGKAETSRWWDLVEFHHNKRFVVDDFSCFQPWNMELLGHSEKRCFFNHPNKLQNSWWNDEMLLFGGSTFKKKWPCFRGKRSVRAGRCTESPGHKSFPWDAGHRQQPWPRYKVWILSLDAKQLQAWMGWNRDKSTKNMYEIPSKNWAFFRSTVPLYWVNEMCSHSFSPYPCCILCMSTW